MLVIVRLLGLYWLIKGIFSLTAIFHPETRHRRGWLIFSSALGIVAGLAVLDHPTLSAIFLPAVLVIFVGLTGLLVGVNDLFAAFRGGGFGIGLLGVTSLLLGGFLLGNTVVGVVVLPYVIGVTEVAGGILALGIAITLRGAKPE